MVQSELVFYDPLHWWNATPQDLGPNNFGPATVEGDATGGVAGVSGLTSFTFDGSGDSVRYADDAKLKRQEFTTTAWVRPADVSGTTQAVVEKGADGRNGWVIWTPDEEFEFWFGDDTQWVKLISETVPKENNWYHLAATFKENDIAELYVNGELEETEYGHNITISYKHNGPFYIGRRYDQGSLVNSFNGNIADVRHYSRVLSPSEIQHLYQVGSADVATPPGASDSGAVSRWTFDDRSDTSTALDEWGANDGTINGAVYDSDSIRGLSMNFTASNSEYITVPGGTFSSFDPTSDWSLSVWLKPVSTGTAFILDPKDDWDYQFLYDDSGNQQIKFVTYDGTNAETISTTHALNTGSWYNFTLSYDGRREFVDLYLNGIQSNSGTVQTDTVTSDTTNTIGSHSNQSQNFFDGLMDEFRVYSRALSDYEVQQLYQWGTMGVDRRHEVLRQ